ncbi:type I methionyl aminopeptidase [Syntrophotalea acetylenivorans]|uniref:Methionine aminopeptidase n=1 Tax=Syntrophotalea acetylenivorans TaxID=1842532 RepID=A0A1L3GP11_9BACT|nr:type I methionyl aminopeptidase [Syntrophotalea acetylenivorans]APG27677.1 type I methionyl aminopeptidase [Syntrophotalea acetylenivorans]
MIILKSQAELGKMRDAGRVVAEILALLKERIKPGVTTGELDRLAEKECRKRQAKPAFKGYGGFPYSICSSPDEQVVHGFPNDRPLSEGTILSIDFGVIYRGFYGDSAFTVPVGKINKEKQHLIEVTEKSLSLAIEQVQCQGFLYDVARAVQTCVEAEGFSVVREFVGHGIGKGLHEEPQIPNFVPGAGRGEQLRSGMTLAIEPMVNAGSPGVKILRDGWTAVTVDGRPSAHFEHTVAVTENGPQILTQI